MDRSTIQVYCLKKRGTWSDYPFGPESQVMKVGTKLFAILSSADPLRVSLKCDPTLTIVFRQTYAAITPAPYLSKTSWNSVLIDGSIPEEMILSMIDQSYDLVVKGLSKAEREKLIG